MVGTSKLRGRTEFAFIIIILTILAVISLTPLWWLIVTALTKATLVLEFPPKIFPNPPTLNNFKEILKFSHIGRWFINTAGISVSVTLASVFLAAMGGYALAKKKFPGSNLFLSI